MNDIHSLLKKYGLVINELEKKGRVVIVGTSDKKYVVKQKNESNSNLFPYLYSRSFNYFPHLYNTDNLDKYDIFDYVNDISMSDQEKGQDIIYLVGLLHSKTTFYQKIDVEDYKIVYEDLKNKILNLKNYYESLNNKIDDEIYMSPSQYLLVRNISKIYASLNYSNYELDSWYDIVKNKDSKRVVTLHNNLRLDHLINNHLISWNKSIIDSPIYDIYHFYKNEYKNLDFLELLKLYEKKYPLLEDERRLLFILMSIPIKYEVESDEYSNTKKVTEILEYLYITDKVISPYYAKKKEEEY